MEQTPRSERIHIGFFGRCNSGKSSLVNALTGQRTVVVSDVAGTTTDAVRKNMELPGIGAVTLIDTAGFDDRGELGIQRIAQTRRAADQTDVAVMVCTNTDLNLETEWLKMFRERNIPVVVVLNKADTLPDVGAVATAIEHLMGQKLIVVSTVTGAGVADLTEALIQAGHTTSEEVTITGDLVREGDVVMLVMPQDAQAPKGRLILPQVQTIRELLDKECTIVSCTPRQMARSLAALAVPPRLVITDSQVFNTVSALTPQESLLTSFSVLFAHYKGDIRLFVEGAEEIGRLTESSRVLIAEACTHAPASEDIGRVKLPRMLRAKIGEGLCIDVVGGNDFPEDLTPYDLVIHCGACMFNRRYVLSRIAQAEAQGVPVTNYGVAIASLMGVLERVVYPGITVKKEFL